jgi:hypothetical protein
VQTKEMELKAMRVEHELYERERLREEAEQQRLKAEAEMKKLAEEASLSKVCAHSVIGDRL